MQEDILSVDSADDRDRCRFRRHTEDIAIFERDMGDAGDGPAVGLEL